MSVENIKNPSVTEEALALQTDASGYIVSISGHQIAGGGGGGTGDYTAGIDLKIENNIISVDTNGNPNNTASNTRNFVEGSWTVASGYMNHAEGVATSALGYGVHAQGMWTKFSSNDGQLTKGGTGPIYWGVGAGATVEGYCNATTSCPMSGTESNYGPVHGGIIKVIGNGYVENEEHETDVHVPHPSDALIIYRDGCISAAGKISANGVELGAGGGTSYQGRSGVNVNGGYIELTQTAYNAITSVPSISNDVTTLKNASADWNKVNDKLDTTAFSTVSGNFLTEVPNTYALKTDIPTTVAQLTDSGNYYQKTETSGAIELSTEFGKYALKSEIPTVPTKVSDLTDSANYYKITETSSKNELSTEFAKYLTTAQYNTDSATFALKSDLNGLVNSASVTTNDNYVMTNTGWKVLTLPGGGMTKVYHDTTLTGDGNANDNQLGVKWETLSSNTIAYSNSAFNLTNGTSVSSFNQISAAIDSRYSKTASDGRYLQKSLDNTLTGDGTNNKKLGVAWSALSSNKIDSAKSANSAEYITNGVGYSGFDDISAKFGSLSSYVPFSATELPIGTNNTATQTAAAIGISNTASVGSFALGKENTATNTACAIGSANSAGNGSFVAGRRSTAYDASVAFEESNYASGRAVAFGHSNTAKNYSYTFGRGLGYTGPATEQWNMGAFVVGCWNNTTTWDYTNNSAGSPLFIVGNGASDSNTKDAFIVYRNGAIKAGSDTTAKENNSVAFGALSQASGNCAFVAGAWCTAIGQGSQAEGNSCGTTGYGNHIQGSFNTFESTGSEYNGPANTPVFVGGTLNATTAQNYNDHGGYLQIMGNGTYQSQGSGTRSDAYILYRDGTVSAKQFQNADGTETINGTTYSFTGVDNIEILPNAATANTANFPNDNVLRFILES